MIQSIRKSPDPRKEIREFLISVQNVLIDVDISGSVGGSVSTMSGDIKYRKNLV